ncbi:MAG TPA: hypothetical protein VKX25_01675 [Bryobacteraceae bacterium]|jgi:hypothetical protein|nr:hypothetical protein [Bryobacteraceae bacterium]
MNWTQVASGLSELLSLVLVIRLFSMRLHSAYRVFCVFLLFEVLTQSFVFIERYTALNELLDYRVTWLVVQVISWVVSIWMVYALLRAIMDKLPGILRFSRRVLNVALVLAVAVSAVSGGPEYWASGASSASARLNYLVGVGLVLSRMVATICVLTLLVTLLFILWFPVRMPRNLAMFSVGFAVYFSAKTFLLLFHNFWSHQNATLVTDIVTLILSVCLLYWILYLNPSGELVQVTLGHSWGREKQTGLLKDLEHLNAVLGRAGRG